MKLNVISGSNIPKLDWCGTDNSDPWVKISLVRRIYSPSGSNYVHELIGDSATTHRIMHEANPFWNKEFYFRVKPKEHTLILQVFDYDSIPKIKNEFIGTVSIELLDVIIDDDERIIDRNYTLLKAWLRPHIIWHSKKVCKF